MDSTMHDILNGIWNGICIYTQWEATHFLKIKYLLSFLLFGLPFVAAGFHLFKVLPSLIMPHVIEMGDVSAEVKRRAQKEFDAIQSTIDKEALK